MTVYRTNNSWLHALPRGNMEQKQKEQKFCCQKDLGLKTWLVTYQLWEFGQITAFLWNPILSSMYHFSELMGALSAIMHARTQSSSWHMVYNDQMFPLEIPDWTSKMTSRVNKIKNAVCLKRVHARTYIPPPPPPPGYQIILMERVHLLLPAIFSGCGWEVVLESHVECLMSLPLSPLPEAYSSRTLRIQATI